MLLFIISPVLVNANFFLDPWRPCDVPVPERKQEYLLDNSYLKVLPTHSRQT